METVEKPKQQALKVVANSPEAGWVSQEDVVKLAKAYLALQHQARELVRVLRMWQGYEDAPFNGDHDELQALVNKTVTEVEAFL